MTVRIVHKNSSASGKNPTSGQLANGELSINYHSDGPFLSLKDTAGNIVRVGGVWISNSSPPDPKKGALWVDPDNNILYVRDDAQWIPIAGGGNGGGAGDLTAVTEGPGIDVAESAGPIPKVSIDLHAQSGLETTPAGDSGKLRVNAGTGLRINAGTGALEATAGGLTYIGVVSCDDDADLQDADVNQVYACDTTTVNGTNSVTASWYTCITNLASPADVSVGDLLICTTAGGGTPANSRYTRLATGGANQITTINANEGLTATVAGGNTVNLAVDLHSGANGNTSGLETNPAGNDGELRVRAGAGLTILDTGVAATQGQLAVDADTIPAPDADGNFGFWSRNDTNNRLTPRTAGDDIRTSGDIQTTGTGDIIGGNLEAADAGTLGTGLIMANNGGTLCRSNPGTGLEINTGQLRVDRGNGIGLSGNDLVVTGGDGIEVTAQGVEVDLLANGGLRLTANDGTGELAVQAGDGIELTAQGVEVDLLANGGLRLTDTDGTGELAVDIAQLPISGKNFLYNVPDSPAGVINQREYVNGSATTAANQYTIDRWIVVVLGEALSWTTDDTVDFRFTAPAGGVEQRILAGELPRGQYTVSWSGTATCQVSADGGAFTQVNSGGQFTITNTSSTFRIRMINGAFSELKVERGNTATQYVAPDRANELMRCAYYYERMITEGRSFTLPSLAGTQDAHPQTRSHCYLPFGYPKRRVGDAANISIVRVANGVASNRLRYAKYIAPDTATTNDEVVPDSIFSNRYGFIIQRNSNNNYTVNFMEAIIDLEL